MIEQLQKIIDKTRRETWGLGEDATVYISEHQIEVAHADYGVYIKRVYSYHDLFSVESGLMQAVKWKHKINRIHFRPTSMFDFLDENGDLTTDMWQFHAMMMSLLDKQGKVKYFCENVLDV